MPRNVWAAWGPSSHMHTAPSTTNSPSLNIITTLSITFWAPQNYLNMSINIWDLAKLFWKAWSWAASPPKGMVSSTHPAPGKTPPSHCQLHRVLTSMLFLEASDRWLRKWHSSATLPPEEPSGTTCIPITITLPGRVMTTTERTSGRVRDRWLSNAPFRIQRLMGRCSTSPILLKLNSGLLRWLQYAQRYGRDGNWCRGRWTRLKRGMERALPWTA